MREINTTWQLWYEPGGKETLNQYARKNNLKKIRKLKLDYNKKIWYNNYLNLDIEIIR